MENRVFFLYYNINIQYTIFNYRCCKGGMKFIVSSDYKISNNLF